MNSFNVYLEKTSKIMFFLLFPVVFLYNSMVEFNIIPAFLGGGAGVFIVATFFLLFPFVLFSFRKVKGISLLYFILFIMLLLYTTCYVVFHYFLNSSFYQNPDVFRQWLVLIISWCAIFSIGYFWPKKLTDSDVLIMIISIILMAILVFEAIHYLHSDPNKSILSLGRASHSDNLMTYQGYARSLVISGLVILTVIRQQVLFWIMSGLIFSSLFLIGARSEIIGLMLIYPIILYYQFIEHPRLTILMAAIIIVVVSIFIINKFNKSNYVRHMELFNISESKSFQHRKKLNEEALQAIAKNPVIGDFSGHTRTHEGVGHYTHNILSSWRQLGIIGFVLYSTLMLWPVIGTLGLFVRDPSLLQIDIWRILGVISVFMLLLALGAKSIFSSMFALSWGMFIAALRYMEPVNKK